MKFSVIIPVFNVEDYLQKCVDTVLPAIKDKDEIILSLGDSSDGSTELSYRLAKQRDNIRIVHQSGKGLSNARNCAIQQAQGEYILCVDSDDYVNTQLLCGLLEDIRAGHIDEDVIAHDFYRFERKTNSLIPVFQIGDIPQRIGMEFLPHMLRRRQCFWNVWRYIYRKQFLLDNGIVYPENVLSEDVEYTTNVLLAEPTIRFVHCPFYVYTVGRGDSLMDSPTLKRLNDTVSVLTDAISRLNASHFYHAPMVAAQFQFEYLLNLALTVEIDRKERSAALELYRNWKWVLSSSADPVVRWSASVMRIVGIRIAAHGLHCMKLVRRWIRRNMKEERETL